MQPRRFLQLSGPRSSTRIFGFIVVVWHNGRAIASGVFLTTNDVVIYKFGASDANAWKLRPNNLLVWEAIRRSVERGATLFDFGRSDVGQEGLASFKRRFRSS